MGNQVILYSQDFSAEWALIGVRHIIGATDRLEVPGTGEIAPIRHLVHTAGGLLKRTDVQFLQGEGRICSCSSCFLSTGMLQVVIFFFFFPSVIPPWWRERTKYIISYSMHKHIFTIKTFSTVDVRDWQKWSLLRESGQGRYLGSYSKVV